MTFTLADGAAVTCTFTVSQAEVPEDPDDPYDTYDDDPGDPDFDFDTPFNNTGGGGPETRPRWRLMSAPADSPGRTRLRCPSSERSPPAFPKASSLSLSTSFRAPAPG